MKGYITAASAGGKGVRKPMSAKSTISSVRYSNANTLVLRNTNDSRGSATSGETRCTLPETPRTGSEDTLMRKAPGR